MVMKAFTIILLSLAAICAGQDPSTEIQRLVGAGRLAEAQAAINGALKTRASDAQLWNLLGIVEAQQNNPDSAAKAFQRAVRLAPRLESAWLNLGRLYQTGIGGQQNLEKSLAAYETVLHLNPASPEAHHQSALLLFLKRDFLNSLDHLNQLSPADRSRRAALILRCADQAALGERAPALELAGRLIEDPGLEEGDFLAVLPVIASSDDSVALRILEALDVRHISTEKTWPLLAEVFQRRGDWKRARETFEKIAQRTPDAVQPLMDLARVSWQQKDFEGTLGYLAHARDLDPKNAAIHFLFAIACNELRVPVEAKLSLEKALELDPENAYFNYAMGSLLLQWSDKARATPYLERFVARRPDDARGHLALATSYAGAGRGPEARAQLTIPLKDPQTRAGAVFLLACLAKKEEDTDAAVHYFQELISLEPNSPEAHSELGLLFLRRDELDAARRETELALAANPRSFRANDTLLKLYRRANDPRLLAQAEVVKKLIKDRDEEFTLLDRTIEFKTR
jgi:tetratricopeptide (TPR) repeat protein